jgi:hypothetical protein
MARRAAHPKSRKSKTKKATTKRNKVRNPKAKTKKRAKPKPRSAKPRRADAVSSPSTSARNMQEPIPAQPAGRIGLRRPSNKPKAPGPKQPREISQAEPDARFGDARQPESNAREHPDGSIPPLERKPPYKNTDESF